ncbi:MAG: DUF1761 domain-containing protein [Opitutus sp.]|nr:DUF1761 domain-containing protein [Opitutus sp.]
MPDQVSFNYLAILSAAAFAFVLGGIWYAPGVFGRAWMQECGFTEESLKKMGGMGRIFAGSFVLELIMAVNLAAFLGPKATLSFGTFAGAAAGFGWVALSFGVTYLFERRSLRLFFINAGYHAVTFTVMGAIIGAWR